MSIAMAGVADSSSSVSRWRTPRNSAPSMHALRHRAFVLADDAEHHLVGATADRAEPPVAERLRHRVVPREAHAAPVLEAGVADLAAQAAALQLGHRRQLGDVLAAGVELHRAVGEGTQALDLG